MRDLARLVFVMLLVACGSDSKTGGGIDAPDNGGDGNGSNTIDAPGPDASTAGVSCGMMTCATGMECCVTFAMQMANYECLAAGGACQGLNIECDGPEDCTNADACCANFNGGGGGVQCDTPGQGCRELCHTAGDCSVQGSMCCTSQFGGSYCAMTCPP